MSRPPLRLGRIGYLNVLPVYHPLEAGILAHDYEIVSGPPATLNAMLARGELPLSSASSIEYARHPDKYLLVRDLCIASPGPVLSVLLLSRRPLPELGGETLLLTGESGTSAALLRLLLAQWIGVDVRYASGNVSYSLASGRPPTACLVIGDEALRLRQHPDYPHRLDLAEAWQQWTGLPFVFGVWLVSRAAVDAGLFREDPAGLLHRARDWGLTHLDAILDAAGPDCPLTRAELTWYYTHALRYSLGAEELAGMRLFHARLAATGLLPAAPQLCFY